ncbi:MAG: DUF2066 domain-containing protein [Magnetococcales bacterium]|nr:DUF2066 domain-containing protein [Magnetococcales bacterium]
MTFCLERLLRHLCHGTRLVLFMKVPVISDVRTVTKMGYRNLLQCVVWVAILSLSWPVNRAIGATNLYQLEGVTVTVALTADNRDPRAAGLNQAEIVAFRRLLKRMVTDNDQRAKAAQLTAAEKNVRVLVEREVVRAEKRKGDVTGQPALDLTADISFSREKVGQLLQGAGIPYNETPYPTVLIAPSAADGPWSKTLLGTMREMGMSAQLPLGDMDDLLNLTNEQLQRGDEALYRWLEERYQAQRIWSVQVEAAAAPLLRITESAPGGITWREEIKLASPDRSTALRPLLERINSRWVGDHIATGAAPQGEATVLRLQYAANLPAYAAVMKRLQTLPSVSDIQLQQMSAYETVLTLRYQGQRELLLAALAEMKTKTEQTAEEIIVRIP